MNERLTGIMPAIVSPCREDDTFDADRFAGVAEMLYEKGVHGLYVCGATGDGLRMRLDERKSAAKAAVAIAKPHHGTSIIYVGAQSSRDAMDLAAHAASVGADVVSTMSPTRCSSQQTIDYYQDIIRASELPLLVYHIPSLTGFDTPIEEMVRWLQIEGVVGLKLTDWNLFYMKRLRLACPDAVVFNGFDEMLLPGLMYGASGGIGMWYNVFPELFLGIYRHFQNHRWDEALKLQHAFLEFVQLGWKHDMVALFEMVMRDKGLVEFVKRRPRTAFPSESASALRRELRGPVEAIEKALSEMQE
jgi:N-acetylneuraminate lyase